MTLSQKIGKAIHKIRKEKGLSQESLIYDVIGKDKMSVRYLVDVKNGIRNISIEKLQIIATGLGMKMSELTRIAEGIKDEK